MMAIPYQHYVASIDLAFDDVCVCERLAEAAEMVMFEILNSMKPYLSDVHAYISELRPVIGLFLSQTQIR